MAINSKIDGFCINCYYFQQQCNSLLFPDNVTNSQYGLNISDHLHDSIDDISISHTNNTNNFTSNIQHHPGLTLMGVSSGGHNILQPVVLNTHDTGQDDMSGPGHYSGVPGDKSPLPELTQLSSHDFTRGISY